jgi:hypothetical protein
MGHGVAGLLGVSACAAALLFGAGARAWADGALAVGSTGDVVRDGIAFGMVVDVPKEKAADEAVRRCRTFKAQAAADRCKVVATFSGECFAVAYDPQPGTPGAGWGVGRDQSTAHRNAIAMCEETAGPDRKGFCQVESAGCDGQAGATGPVHGADGVPPAKAAPPRRPDFDPWADVRQTLTREERSWFRLDLPLALLLGGTLAGVAFVLSLALKGRAKATPGRNKRVKEATKRSPR